MCPLVRLSLKSCIHFLWLLQQIATNVVVYKTDVLSCSPVSQKSVSAGLCSFLQAPEKNPLPCLVQLLEAACVPWFMDPPPYSELVTDMSLGPFSHSVLCL
jgi:hypothetical protein